MANIGNWFDYQKIADNKELGNIIDEVEAKYGVELSDDELDMVSAGTAVNAEARFSMICPKCKVAGTLVKNSGMGYTCTNCGEIVEQEVKC